MILPTAQPSALMGSAHQRSPVMSIAIGGAPRVMPVATLAGEVVALNAETGEEIYTSPALGETCGTVGEAMVVGRAGVYIDGWYTGSTPISKDLLFVGTRLATGANALHSLIYSNGACDASFSNATGAPQLGDGSGDIGIISGGCFDRLHGAAAILRVPPAYRLNGVPELRLGARFLERDAGAALGDIDGLDDGRDRRYRRLSDSGRQRPLRWHTRR